MLVGLYILSALVGVANGTAVLLVNPRRPINQIYFAGTLITCLWFFSLIKAMTQGAYLAPHEIDENLLFWLRMSSAVPAFIVWQIALMKNALVEASRPLQHFLRETWVWFFVSIGLACLAFSEIFIPSHSTSANKLRDYGYYLYLLVIVLCGIWIFADCMRNLTRLTGIKKLELQYFVSHAVLASLLVTLSSYLGSILSDSAWFRRTGPIWITIWQGSIVWIICHHKIFEGKQAVLLVGQRLLLLCTLSICAVALSMVLSQKIGQTYVILVATMAVGGAALFLDPPMRKWLGLDARQLVIDPRNKIVGWAREGLSEEQLVIRMEELLREWCATDQVQLLKLEHHRTNRPNTFTTDSSVLAVVTRTSWITPEALLRQKESTGTKECAALLEAENLGALLAVPIGSTSPSTLLALGRKHSLRPYTYPDIQVLLELAELMDNILTHAHVAARNAEIEKMESAATMSRGLAHDLNNLTTPVSSFLLHMEERITPGTAEAEVLADAKHSIHVMQDYIRESLFFSRQLVPNIQPQSSTELLVATISSTQNKARSCKVEVLVEPSLDITFAADRVLMLRLLQNLVSNAIDASPAGGRVTLTAKAEEADRIAITVADEGSGVPPDIVDRIFEPYFTTKDTGSKARGLGLGLAISLKIGSLHGGTIQVGRTPSGGAVFTTILPRNPPPARANASSERQYTTSPTTPPCRLPENTLSPQTPMRWS